MGYGGKVREQERARELRAQAWTLQDNLDAAVEFWSALAGIPPSQFTKPYRARADPTIRRAKHVMGCPSIVYHSSAVHRRVMGMIEAVLSPTALPG